MDASHGRSQRRVSDATRKMLTLGPYTFSIGNTTDLSAYKSGGLFTQVKMPKILHFVSDPACRCPFTDS